MERTLTSHLLRKLATEAEAGAGWPAYNDEYREALRAFAVAARALLRFH